MNKAFDGGFAFPQVLTDQTGAFIGCEGMSLRDYFAAKAMEGLVAAITDNGRYLRGRDDMSMEVARAAYMVADAMLAARARALGSDS